MPEAANVLTFTGSERSKCPPGSLAFHPEWGCVSVVAAAGLTRTVEVTDYRPLDDAGLYAGLPADVVPEEVLFGEEHVTTAYEVDVTVLRPAPEFNRSPLAHNRTHYPLDVWK